MCCEFPNVSEVKLSENEVLNAFTSQRVILKKKKTKRNEHYTLFQVKWFFFQDIKLYLVHRRLKTLRP